jgi:hypothetical protein
MDGLRGRFSNWSDLDVKAKTVFDDYRSIVVDKQGQGVTELCDGAPWTQQPAAKRTPDLVFGPLG